MNLVKVLGLSCLVLFSSFAPEKFISEPHVNTSLRIYPPSVFLELLGSFSRAITREESTAHFCLILLEMPLTTRQSHSRSNVKLLLIDTLAPCLCSSDCYHSIHCLSHNSLTYQRTLIATSSLSNGGRISVSYLCCRVV
ncbi:hypothetical protein Pst134EA_002665 [Puccinia striiformis f. sp. tritici]|uniref:hypothetical protein n=1 Tax=Puccinia striiformis f. sp. tritici TaxID=168172 RepID=UPI0020083409|nr:hypothetical protein Pst134EA_002665 [Puccinia striiformis f. sp. tritici]KAH9472038.1 hypothetical protein Pst134EA_002665 [Puccinia striiformis f. sp. tritici]